MPTRSPLYPSLSTFPERWVLLTLERDESGALAVAYEDDRGARYLPGEAWPAFQVRLPPNLEALLGATAAMLPAWRPPPHGSGPVTLPIYVRHAELVAATWPQPLQSLLAQWLPEQAFQLVVLANEPMEARSPLELPFELLVSSEAAPGLVQGIMSLPWLGSLDVREFGLRAEESSALGVVRDLMTKPILPDIVVVPSPSISDAFAAFSPSTSKPWRDPPRLLVGVGSPEFQVPAAVPPGMSVLMLGASSGNQASAYIHDLVHGIIHDYPIPEAVHAAGRRVPTPSLLYSDPESAHGLRMARTVAALIEQGEDLAGVVRMPRPSIGAALPEPLMAKLRSSLAAAGVLDGAAAATRGLPNKYQQEGVGLIPAARAAAQLATARAASHEVRSALDVGDSREDIAALAEKQDRRVDIRLERLEHSPLADRYTATEALWLQPTVHLRSGAWYRVRMQVCVPGPESLVEGNPPSLDSLLLPAGKDGHLLEAALFGLDFDVDGPTVKTFLLPVLGRSQVVTFAVRAPEQLGPARLRLVIYHKNHLVQAFRLDAQVAAEESHADAHVLVVHLERSRSSRLDNVERLGPRALSIGVNQDPGGTHSLCVKATGAAKPLSVGETALTDALDRMRSLLRGLTLDPNGDPTFLVEPAPNALPTAAAEDALRRLAELGWELFQGVFQSAKDAQLKQALRELAKDADKTIQIVRFDRRFSFPWALVYDRALPTIPVDDPPALVCWGGTAANPCNHRPCEAVVCARGFWGVRHQVEDLLDKPSEPAKQPVPSPAKAIRLAAGVSTPAVQDLEVTLKTAGLPLVKHDPAKENLLDVLWGNARPWQVIVIGHYETRDIPKQLPGPRILLNATGACLRATDITARDISDGEWNDPRPLVLLMACSSTVTTPATLNDLLIALNGAGAAAIVGTECTIFTDLVSRFAREVTIDVWKGVAVGKAVTAFRRRMFAEGNPCGMLFSLFGDSDFCVAP